MRSPVTGNTGNTAPVPPVTSALTWTFTCYRGGVTGDPGTVEVSGNGTGNPLVSGNKSPVTPRNTSLMTVSPVPGLR